MYGYTCMYVGLKTNKKTTQYAFRFVNFVQEIHLCQNRVYVYLYLTVYINLNLRATQEYENIEQSFQEECVSFLKIGWRLKVKSVVSSMWLLENKFQSYWYVGMS